MLPIEIAFYRESNAVGETTYVFQHTILGTLGRLRLLSFSNNTRLIWEPCTEDSNLKEQLENFIETLIKSLQTHFKAHEYHWIPCRHCGLAIARFIYFAGVKNLNVLKERALLSTIEDSLLPTWILGEQGILEVIWLSRRLFRPVNSSELAASLNEFESQHCTKTLKLSRVLQ